MQAVKALSSLTLAPQSRFPRPDNRPRPVGHLQLAKDIGDVISHCLRAEHETFDDCIAQLYGKDVDDDAKPESEPELDTSREGT